MSTRGTTTTEAAEERARPPLPCRLLGCEWRFRPEGRAVVQECSRGCGRHHRGELRRTADATRLSRYLAAASRRPDLAAPWRWLVNGRAA